MRGLMFLFIVDIAVGCHLVKGGESRFGKSPELYTYLSSSHQAQVISYRKTECSAFLQILHFICMHERDYLTLYLEYQ